MYRKKGKETSPPPEKKLVHGALKIMNHHNINQLFFTKFGTFSSNQLYFTRNIRWESKPVQRPELAYITYQAIYMCLVKVIWSQIIHQGHQRSRKVIQGHARGHRNLKLPGSSEVNESLQCSILGSVKVIWSQKGHPRSTRSPKVTQGQTRGHWKVLYLERVVAKTRGHKVIYMSGQGHLVPNYPSRSSKVKQGHSRSWL